MVSGVNLPAAQLQIAMGIPLSSIKDIRILYGLSPSGNSDIDFEFKNPESHSIQRRPAARGHVIATRITAENPEAGFKPNSGRFLELNFKSNSNVWGYFSVNSAGGVHEYADSQFGHLFAYGESREEARKSLIMALKEISIRGDFRTTVQYLVKLLEHPTFEANEFSTSWLDALIKTQAEEDMVGSAEDVVPALCGAVARAFSFYEKGNNDFISALQKGKVPLESLLKTEYSIEFILNNIQYVSQVSITGRESYCVSINDQSVDIIAKLMVDDGLLLVFGGKSHIVYLKDDGAITTLVVDSKSYNLEKDYDPSQLRSPSPGKLVRYLRDDGEHIKSGDAYAEIEVMKMYMPLITKVSGFFKATKLVSSILSTGDVIGILNLDDPLAVKRALPYNGVIPDFDDSSTVEDDKPHHKLKRLNGLIDNVLLGYEPLYPLKLLLNSFLDALHDKDLPIYEFAESLGSISSRIPQTLSDYLYQVVLSSREFSLLDCDQIESAIQESIEALPLDEQDGVIAVIAPMRDILFRYRDGVEKRARQVLLSYLKSYYQLEMVFDKATQAKAILELRETYKNDLGLVRDMVRANSKPKTRSSLICLILDVFENETVALQQKEASEIFERLANLSTPGTQLVSLRAREILMRIQTPSALHRREVLLKIFEKAIKTSKDGTDVEFDFSSLGKTITSRYSMLDILPELFFHSDTNIRAIALYIYVMRTNQAYIVTSFKHHFLEGGVVLSWNFEHQNKTLFEPIESEDDQSASEDPTILSIGIIFTCHVLEDLVVQVKSMKSNLALPKNNSGFMFNATVALKASDEFAEDESTSAMLANFIDLHREFLVNRSIARVTFMFVNPNSHSRYFTYNASRSYAEYSVIRHIEPFMSHRLEMERLANFEVKPTHTGQRGIQIFHAIGRKNPTDVRFFVRGIIHPTNVGTFQDFFISEANRASNGILGALEILAHRHPNTDCNHILIHFIPVFDLTIDKVRFYFDKLLRLHGARLSKLRVNEVEICYTGYHPKSRVITPIRFVAVLHSQYVIDISWYTQKKSNSGDVLFSVSPDPGPFHGQSVHRLHAPKESIQPKRYKAHLLGTTYIYDFPALFRESIKQEWFKVKLGVSPAVLLDCIEMVLNSSGNLEPSKRAPGITYV